MSEGKVSGKVPGARSNKPPQRTAPPRKKLELFPETAAQIYLLLDKYNNINIPTEIKEKNDLYYLKKQLEIDMESLGQVTEKMGELKKNKELGNDDSIKKIETAIEEIKKIQNLVNLNKLPENVKSVEDLNNNIYKNLLMSKKKLEKKITTINKKGESERKTVKNIISKLWTKYVSLEGEKIQKIINNITNSNKMDNTTNVVEQFKNELKNEIDSNIDATQEQIEVIVQQSKKDVKTADYINYIENLSKLMIKNKKDELKKLNEIGNKVIDLDKAKKQLSKLKEMLAEAEEDDAKNEKNLDELENDSKTKTKEKIKTEVPGDGQEKTQGAKAVKAKTEETERLMKEQMTNIKSGKVGMVDESTKTRAENIKNEEDTTKATITNLKNVLPSLDIIPEQLREDEKIVIGEMEDKAFNDFLNGIKDDELLKDSVTGNKKLFSDVLKQEGAEIRLLQGKPTGEENVKETIVLTTMPTKTQFSIDKILVVDSNNMVKWLDIKDSDHFYKKIEEEQDTFKNVEKNIAEKKEKEDKIFYANYGKFTAKDDYIKLLVDIDYEKYNKPKKGKPKKGGGKRKSKSRKSKKRRKGRKNKTKKRSKSKK